MTRSAMLHLCSPKEKAHRDQPMRLKQCGHCRYES
jgi:hypothetical protein